MKAVMFLILTGPTWAAGPGLWIGKSSGVRSGQRGDWRWAKNQGTSWCSWFSSSAEVADCHRSLKNSISPRNAGSPDHTHRPAPSFVHQAELPCPLSSRPLPPSSLCSHEREEGQEGSGKRVMGKGPHPDGRLSPFQQTLQVLLSQRQLSIHSQQSSLWIPLEFSTYIRMAPN